MKLDTARAKRFRFWGVALFAPLQPLAFLVYYRFPRWTGADTGVLRTNHLNDLACHLRWIAEGARNLERGRFWALNVAPPAFPHQAFPHFQYYGAGLYAGLGALARVFGDPFLALVAGYALASLTLQASIGSAVFRLTRSTATALGFGAIAASSPYWGSQILEVHLLANYVGVALVAAILAGALAWIDTGSMRAWIALVAGLSALPLTHALSAFLAAVFLPFPFIARIQEERPTRDRWAGLATALAAALALTAFIWWPILRDGDHVQIQNTYAAFWARARGWLTLGAWLTPVPYSPLPGESFHPNIGWPLLFAAILAFTPQRKILAATLLGLGAVLAGIWEPRFLKPLQFPFRLLDPLFFLALIGARPWNVRQRTMMVALLAVFGPLSLMREVPLHLQRFDLHAWPPGNWDQFLTAREPAGDYARAAQGRWNADLTVVSFAIPQRGTIALPIYFSDDHRFTSETVHFETIGGWLERGRPPQPWTLVQADGPGTIEVVVQGQSRRRFLWGALIALAVTGCFAGYRVWAIPVGLRAGRRASVTA